MLFDIDGTLLRGAGLHHRNALIDGVRRVSGHVTTLDGVATSGMLDRDLIAGMLRASGASDRQIRSQMTEIVRECQRSYLENCTVDLRPFVCRAVPETLEQLQAQGAVLGLVTGNLSEIGWRKIELAGLRSYFSVGAFAEDGKTRSRLALVAARRALREKLVEKNCRISLIGDHPNDIAAAKANGFQAVAVATGLMPFEELARETPDILVEHLSDLDLEKLL